MGMRVSGAVIFLFICLASIPCLASPGFFDSSCAGCHLTVPPTCNGCHPHGVRPATKSDQINLTGTTDKTGYGAGETVSVTVTGGNKTGWVRVILYDDTMKAVAISAGPDGIGGGAGFPLVLTAPAPPKSGTYRWTVAWYGSRGESSPSVGSRWNEDERNPGHGWELVTTNEFTVVAGPDPTAILDPVFLDFGVVPPGATARRTVRISNGGTAVLSITSVIPCDTGNQVSWSPSSLLVSPGASELLQVSFSPVAATPPRGCLRLFTNDPQNPVMLLMITATPSASAP